MQIPANPDNDPESRAGLGDQVDDRRANDRFDDRSLNDRPLNDRRVNDRYEEVAPAGTVLAEPAAVVVDSSGTNREQVLEREKAEFGGMKFGSAFFGWLAATGTAVLLTAAVAATGAAVGYANPSATNASAQATTASTVGLVGAIVLVAIILVAYLCGGYVAGRMARFSGVKQGIAVWLWAIIAAIVVAILGAIAGSRFSLLANLDSMPRIPIDQATLTVGGIVTALAIIVASLLGAILGGLLGMRYHRRVDRAGLGR